MIHIIAGTRAQAKHIAEKHGLRRSDWRFVSKPADLLGLRGKTVWTYGSYDQRPDFVNMMNFLLASDARHIHQGG